MKRGGNVSLGEERSRRHAMHIWHEFVVTDEGEIEVWAGAVDETLNMRPKKDAVMMQRYLA
jgi:hypothetical protein